MAGSAEAAKGCPERMDAGDRGGRRCVHCGAGIPPGELYLTAGRCPMGGLVTGAGAGAYSDMLEPEAEHLRCAAKVRGAAAPCCFTVGHGTRPLEELVAMLREQGITLLADIRTVPGSRHNPQFGAAALARGLQDAGLCYLHLPGLGGLRKPRPDSPNSGWRNESFRGYADYMLTGDFEAALAELVFLMRLYRTAIMCAETVYWRCHRALVADALLVRGFSSLHLMQPGKQVPHTLTRFAQPEKDRVLYPPEPSQVTLPFPA